MSRGAAPAVYSAPTGSALPVGVPGASLTPKFQVRVRYAKRMRLQRVYSMIVELRPEGKSPASGVSSGDSVIARPIIPGAHVQPMEQELGPKSSNNKITFSVTPLAAGKLSGARLQILHSGRVLDEVKTPIRSIRPGRVLMWAGLTLLAFAYLAGIFGPLPDLSSKDAKAQAAKPAVPMPDGDKPVAAVGMPGENPATTPDLKGKTTVANVLSWNEKLPDYLELDNLGEDMGEYISKGRLEEYAQQSYDAVYKLPNLNFYIFVGLLVITLLSVFLNRPAILRSSRKGKAMMLPSLPH
jgi:hypothetical protein